MKLLSLKLKAYSLMIAVSCLAIMGITSGVTNNAPTNSEIDTHLSGLLRTCLLDKASTQPFSYFVDEMAILITKNKNYFIEKYQDKPCIVDNLLKAFTNIRNSNRSKDVLSTLTEFKPVLSFYLPKASPFALLSGLNYRLSLQNGQPAPALEFSELSFWQKYFGWLLNRLSVQNGQPVPAPESSALSFWQKYFGWLLTRLNQA